MNKPGYYKGELRPCECGGIPFLKRNTRYGSLYLTLECPCGLSIERGGTPKYDDKIKKLVFDKWNNRPTFDKAIDALMKAERADHYSNNAIDIRGDIMDLTGLTYFEALEIYKQRQEKEG